MPHVDDGTLHALLDGALRAEEPARADEAEAHLQTCADCRARLDQATEIRALASDVLASLDAEDGHAVSPDFGDVLARAARHTGPSRTVPGAHDDTVFRQYRWTRRVAWAATIVVALGTGYFVRDLVGPAAQRPGQGLMLRQVPVQPVDAADAMESATAGREDTAPQTKATPGAETAEDGRGQQPAQIPERRAIIAPADPEVDIGAEPRQQNLTARAPDSGEEEGLGGARLELSDEIAAPASWVQADMTDVENRVGTILLLPGAEIARAELLPGIDTVARTVQVLPDGVEIQVIQTIASLAEVGEGEPTDSDAAAAPVIPAETDRAAPAPTAVDIRARLLSSQALSVSDADSLAPAAGAVHVVHAAVGRYGVMLTLVGPLPRAVLEQLAAAAEPRPR